MKFTCAKCGFHGIPKTEKSNVHIKASCFDCGAFIKFLSQSDTEDDFKLYFGKFKGRNVKSMVGNTKEEFDYLKWLLNQNYIVLKNNQIEILKKLTK